MITQPWKMALYVITYTLVFHSQSTHAASGGKSTKSTITITREPNGSVTISGDDAVAIGRVASGFMLGSSSSSLSLQPHHNVAVSAGARPASSAAAAAAATVVVPTHKKDKPEKNKPKTQKTPAASFSSSPSSHAPASSPSSSAAALNASSCAGKARAVPANSRKDREQLSTLSRQGIEEFKDYTAKGAPKNALIEVPAIAQFLSEAPALLERVLSFGENRNQRSKDGWLNKGSRRTAISLIRRLHGGDCSQLITPDGKKVFPLVENLFKALNIQEHPKKISLQAPEASTASNSRASSSTAAPTQRLQQLVEVQIVELQQAQAASSASPASLAASPSSSAATSYGSSAAASPSATPANNSGTKHGPAPVSS